MDFAQSKWPHFHRVYLVTLCKRGATAVSDAKVPLLTVYEGYGCTDSHDCSNSYLEGGHK